MILKIYPKNPDENQIQKVVEILKNGGIAIIPTDSVYGIACSIYSSKAIEKLAGFKGVKPEKAEFSFIFDKIANMAEYTKPISNDTFKILKKNLPGPFTFILESNLKVQKIFSGKKKTIGVRIPNNNITLEIVRQLGNPIINTSVHDEDEILEYTTDPSLIHERYESLVDVVIDGGYGNNEPTAIIDCTGEIAEILRDGVKELL